MRPAEAAIIAGVHRKTIHVWAETHPKLISRDGRFWTVNKEELLKIIDARKVLKGMSE